MSHCSIFIAAFEGEIAGSIFKNICPHHVQIGSGGPAVHISNRSDNN